MCPHLLPKSATCVLNVGRSGAKIDKYALQRRCQGGSPMDDNDWLAANEGTGLDIAEEYIAEAEKFEPIKAISTYLLAIDILQIHIGRMDTASQLARITFGDAKAQRQ